MRTIKILGTGCAKCKQTEAAIRDALGEMGVTANVVKVEDIESIMEYDVMSTPAIVIDESVVMTGKVPTTDEVRAMMV